MAKKIQCDGCDKLEDESTAKSMGWDSVTISDNRAGRTTVQDLCQTCLDIFWNRHIPKKWVRSE